MAQTADKTEKQMMIFKGKPLVRSGNTIYYGSMAEPYVALLQIQNSEDMGGTQMSGSVSVQLLSTNPNRGPRERVIKKTEKNGLYNALNIASIWLFRYLESSEK